MTDLRGRVWRRLFGSKKFLIPAAVAVGTGCIAAISGGVWIAVAVAFGFIAAGSVVLQLASGAEKLEKIAVNDLAKEKLEREELRLKDLQKKLRSDRDFRTKDCFNLATQARNDFLTLIKTSPGNFATLQFGQQFDQLFWATIEQLEHSLQLYEQADRLVDARRLGILTERDRVVGDLIGAADRLRQVVDKIRSTSTKDREVELSSLSKELDDSLEIAKRVDQRLKELESEPNRDEFLKQ
jgi:hypothetical protein